jgi:O-succinylbenzoic acid--CoA ligase
MQNDFVQMPDWLSQRVALSPNASALIFDDLSNPRQEWTFAQLQQEVLALATQLQPHLVKGQAVALLLSNSPYFVFAVHALMQLEAVIVPLNTRLTNSELIWQLQDVKAGLLLSESCFAERLPEIEAALPHLKLFKFKFEVDTQPTSVNTLVEPRPKISLNTLHTIIYSSGTTGRPKGVMLSYGNHWWSAIASSLNLGLYSHDNWLGVLPLFHVGGMSLLFKSVIYGMPILLQSYFDEVAVNRALDEQAVTIVSVVSTMLQRMLDQRADRPYPTSLRCVLIGGGPVPQPLLERCAAIGLPIVQSYGLTETSSQNTTLAPSDALTRLGSAGKPLFPNQIKIENPDASGVGEILVSGPTVTSGYWERPVETAQALREGWLHTGDLGRLDEAGFLYVVDRRNDLIISGGENVYPAEVEAVLLAHPAVDEAGVFGLPDVRWGQVVAAVVKLRPSQNLAIAELQAFCSSHLARYKVPNQIFWLLSTESLPRNAAGKLLRRELRSRYGNFNTSQQP